MTGGPMLDDQFAAILQWVGGIGAILGAGVVGYRQLRQGAREVAAVRDESVIAALEQQRETNALLQEDSRELRRQNDTLRERIAVVERREDARDELDRTRLEFLQRHAAWDFSAVEALRHAGLTLDAPPPLYPPPHTQQGGAS